MLGAATGTGFHVRFGRRELQRFLHLDELHRVSVCRPSLIGIGCTRSLALTKEIVPYLGICGSCGSAITNAIDRNVRKHTGRSKQTPVFQVGRTVFRNHRGVAGAPRILHRDAWQSVGNHLDPHVAAADMPQQLVANLRYVLEHVRTVYLRQSQPEQACSNAPELLARYFTHLGIYKPSRHIFSGRTFGEP